MRTEILGLNLLAESPFGNPDLNVIMRHRLPWQGSVENVCQVSIWGDVVIISEPLNNPGVSITNSIEYIATSVAHQWFPDRNPDDMIWIEHLPSGRIRSQDTWHLVRFLWAQGENGWYASDPQWKPLTAEEVGRLVESRRNKSNTPDQQAPDGKVESCQSGVAKT